MERPAQGQTELMKSISPCSMVMVIIMTTMIKMVKMLKSETGPFALISIVVLMVMSMMKLRRMIFTCNKSGKAGMSLSSKQCHSI